MLGRTFSFHGDAVRCMKVLMCIFTNEHCCIMFNYIHSYDVDCIGCMRNGRMLLVNRIAAVNLENLER